MSPLARALLRTYRMFKKLHKADAIIARMLTRNTIDRIRKPRLPPPFAPGS